MANESQKCPPGRGKGVGLGIFRGNAKVELLLTGLGGGAYLMSTFSKCVTLSTFRRAGLRMLSGGALEGRSGGPLRGMQLLQLLIAHRNSKLYLERYYIWF